MKKSLTPAARICSAISAILLLVTLWVPIWRIELIAPQYPGGLILQIGANGLSGDVDVINGLNHYIGMRTLHTKDFFEFTILPYLIDGIVLFGFLTVIVNRRWFFYTWAIFVGVFCVAALIDFYIWEYNYGHNLDPTAPIKVTGMSYQPPLIGYKKLLNFGAYSIPDTGGWLFIAGVLIVVAGVLIETGVIERIKNRYRAKHVVKPALLLMLFCSCNAGPEPIRYGVDNCSHCRMKIVNVVTGAEIITEKGKIYKFDDIICLQSFLTTDEGIKGMIKDIYLTDFIGNHQLVKAEQCQLIKSDQLHTPMNGGIIAVSHPDSVQKVLDKWGGERITWATIYPGSK